MARIVPATKRMKPARHLLFARTNLQLHLTQIKSRKVVPQPAYLAETSSSEEDWDNIDSDSAETDTDTDSSDCGTDVVAGDSDKARSEKVNIPTNTDQTGCRNFNPPFGTKQEMEVLKDRDENMDEDKDEVLLIPMEIYAPNDQRTSDMVPPPTPKLSHIELPLPSIESDTAYGCRKELLDAFMEESKGGDSSSNANADVCPFSMEIDECEDRSARPTKAVQPEPKLPAKDPATHATSTENSGQPSRPVLLSTKQIKEGHKRRTPLPNLIRIPGLTSVAINQDDFTETSGTVSKNGHLPEQPPSLRPFNLVLGKNVQEEGTDRTAEPFTDDMESIEEDMLAEYYYAQEAERKFRCRAHDQLNHEHASCILRLNSYAPGNGEIRGRRPYDAKEISNIKRYRLHLANWKKHAVWNRSILSIEVKLAPLNNVSGQYRTYMKYHLGRGPTGGNPAKMFWRHCNPRGNGCEAH